VPELQRYLVDYHLHTPRCGHAQGRPGSYVERARQLGLAEVGFADHLPLLHLRDPHLSMGLEELPLYLEEVQELRELYPDIPIRLGIEADYVPGELERLRELLSGRPFDYVYGSVHYLDGWGFDDPRYIDGYRGRDLRRLYLRYFEVLGDAAECGLFDILAHPDLIKKFGFRPPGDLSELYEDCLLRVAASGLAVEVNTAGLRKPAQEIYPHPDFLRRCRELDIPVTLGSDAHAPEEVGRDFEPAALMLEEAGYEEIAVFEGRRRRMVPLLAAGA
jgi:histidinol-phosphatase (PHP family)